MNNIVARMMPATMTIHSGHNGADMPKHSAQQNRLTGLRGKLTRQMRDADELAARGIFIDRGEIRDTEHRIAMLEQELSANSAAT